MMDTLSWKKYIIANLTPFNHRLIAHPLHLMSTLMLDFSDIVVMLDNLILQQKNN